LREEFKAEIEAGVKDIAEGRYRSTATRLWPFRFHARGDRGHNRLAVENDGGKITQGSCCAATWDLRQNPVGIH